MAIYLSPGVFPREIDLSLLPNAIGPMRPAFIGTAKKGPMNTAVLLANPQIAIDTYGEPFQESYFMYAILAYMEEGNECYAMRIGVECEEGQAATLEAICVDTSGARGNGWGRIPLFTGIDYGRINLRAIGDGVGDNPLPYVFHAASISAVEYNDVQASGTFGVTNATLNVTGDYTGDVDDSFVMVITSPPDVSAAGPVDGATFEVLRNSDGEIVADGTLSDGNDDGVSQVISIGDGVSIQVAVTSGVLDENDTFIFSVVPDNLSFEVSIEGASPTLYDMPAGSHTTVQSFITAANVLVAADDYSFVEYMLEDGSTIPQIRSDVAGERIQITDTQAWALEVGSMQYAWDIPRAYLIGLDAGPFDITTQKNRVALDLVGETTTLNEEFSIAVGTDQTAVAVAASINAGGVVGGQVVWESFALTVPGGTDHVIIVASVNNQLDTLLMKADYSHLKTLRFAEELVITYPYKRSYRGFFDARTVLPASGEIDAAVPLSCETDPGGDECVSDTAYFQSVVGWFVATSPGTWVDGYSITLDSFTAGLGDASGRYKMTIYDQNKQTMDSVDDISFDKREDRYIGNVINPGTTLGGANGNSFINWEERPAFLENNINDLTTFVVRKPSQFNQREYSGQANGIPVDPAYSSELDAAVIGNPSTSTGLYAFQNPEAIDINLLVTPGFSTGAVIGTALQICESRGDVLYIVDPPFGLRPQQVVDWHNGMLLSDLNTAINSSYGALYWSWLRTFDQFSASEMWVPPSGHVSAVFSRTARVADHWFAPAGLRRGKLFTALDVEYSPAKGESDLLYGSGNAVNPIVKFTQDGITIFGQRTLQRSASALDRVNVRMLLIHIKKHLTSLLRNYIFEPNDSVLWRQVLSSVNPFLGDIQSRRGLQAYKIVIDSTNNTPERIDRNELWVSIFLQPTRTVEFVVLNLVVMRTGASFSAEEVLAAGGVG